MTQKELIMNHLESGKTLTPFQAYELYGITKLATVVSDLIHEDGQNIKKVMAKGKNRYGKTVCYMTYSLGEEDAQHEVEN